MCSTAIFSSVFEKRLEVEIVTYHVMGLIEMLPSVTAEEEQQHPLENSHQIVIRKLAKMSEGPWQVYSKSWKTEGIPEDLKTPGTGLVFENDERNDTGSYEIIILTVLVRKYRAVGFGLQNKELEVASILVGR